MNMLLHDVGVVSQDMPGTLMTGGREWGKEGSKEGNWNGQQFLCYSFADLILNIQYWSTTFVTCQKRDNWAFKACTKHFPGVIDIISTYLNLLHCTCLHYVLKGSDSELWYKGTENKLVCSICWFPLPVNLWDGGVLSWLREQRWRRNLSVYKLLQGQTSL